MNKVFDFGSTSTFLSAILNDESTPRGTRSLLADHLGVQKTFISLLSSGKQSMSLEQALKIAKFFNLNRDETYFLVTLAQINRTSDPELIKIFESQKEKIISKHNKIANRIKVKESLDVADQQIYYSNPHYTFLHILSAIPGFQTIEKMAEVLHLDLDLTKKYLNFLITCNLVKKNEKKPGEFQIGGMRIHLPKDSPLLPAFHTHLRNHAISRISKSQPDDVRYTASYALTKNQYKKIKDILLTSLENVEKSAALKGATPETLCVMNLDFYEIGN